MKELFLQISNRQDLTQEQVQEVFDQILQNQLSESQKQELYNIYQQMINKTK